jgi:hypothetical protein
MIPIYVIGFNPLYVGLCCHYKKEPANIYKLPLWLAEKQPIITRFPISILLMNGITEPSREEMGLGFNCWSYSLIDLLEALKGPIWKVIPFKVDKQFWEEVDILLKVTKIKETYEK